MNYSFAISCLFRRSRYCLSFRSVLVQTPFFRFFRTNSAVSNNKSASILLQNRICVVSRLKQENTNTGPLSYSHRCMRTYSSETSKPNRQTVGNKTVAGKSKESKNEKETKPGGESSTQEPKLTLLQRFHKTYKEHAKILIGVHLVTSAVWFGGFFYAAHVGIDVIPLLEKIGFSEKIIKPFRSSSLGDVALAYLMYKLATPARYTVTLAGTNYAIKYFRKVGRVPAKQTGLVKEAVEYGTAQTRHSVKHMKTRYIRAKGRLEQSRLKMRHSARTLSTRLKTKFHIKRKGKTKVNGRREKINGRKTKK